MRIALVGYGRMWHMIESLARSRGDEISIIVSPETGKVKEDILTSGVDVVIDFSIASVALENMQFYAEHDLHVVMGTTGWYGELAKVKDLFVHSRWAIIWWGNFSLGVHLYWKMIENAAKIMNQFGDYDVYGHEFHHREKSDSPSGTALTTAQILLEHIERKDTLITEALTERKIWPNELHFSSSRGGRVPGTHSVYFDSPFDTIELTHTARTREGFALGSLLCAEWIQSRQWYYEIHNFLDTLIDQ